MQQIGEFLLSSLITASAVYSSYKAYVYLTTTLFDREYEFPPDAHIYHFPFGDPLTMACQVSTNGVFSLLTGISCTALHILGQSSRRYDFNVDTLHPSKIVTMVSFSWSEPSSLTRPTFTQLFHAMVYHNGYIYQSYKTSRFLQSWLGYFSSATDSYPLVRQKLERKEDRYIFEEDISLMTPEIFNRLCAPSCHPIPKNAKLRCTELNRASINPTRDELTIKEIKRSSET